MRTRIKHIKLLVACIIAFLWKGKANRHITSPKRIIVVPTGKLGDVVCCTPVLQAIRKHFPLTEIVVSGNRKLHEPLLANSGLVDTYIDLDAEGIAGVKKINADAALITGPAFYPAAIMYLAGVPLVVAARVVGGFSPQETRPYQILKKMIITFPFEIGKYAPRERLKVLEPLGIFEENTTKRLGYSVEAKEKISQFLKQKNLTGVFLVGITASAGNKIKEWPPDRFAEVADYVQKNNKGRVVLLGGPNDQELSNKVKKYMKTEVVDTTGMWNIDELKAFIARLNMFISVDTGPIYIAEAFGVPTIDIVGPVDENEQPPISDIHRVVVPERKKPEVHILNARVYDPKKARRQAVDISSEAVIRVFELLKNNI